MAFFTPSVSTPFTHPQPVDPQVLWILPSLPEHHLALFSDPPPSTLMGSLHPVLTRFPNYSRHIYHHEFFK